MSIVGQLGALLYSGPRVKAAIVCNAATQGTKGKKALEGLILAITCYHPEVSSIDSIGSHWPKLVTWPTQPQGGREMSS